MPVRFTKNGDNLLLILEGVIGAEDTDEVVGVIKENPDLLVDLSECDHLHTAVLQALMVLRPKISAMPADSFWSWCNLNFTEEENHENNPVG